MRRDWTVLNEPGGTGSFYLSSGGGNPSGSGKLDVVHSGFGQFAVAGQLGPSAAALVSPPHTVVAGDKLSFSYLVENAVALPVQNSMSFTVATNQQARAPCLRSRSMSLLQTRRSATQHVPSGLSSLLSVGCFVHFT